MYSSKKLLWLTNKIFQKQIFQSIHREKTHSELFNLPKALGSFQQIPTNVVRFKTFVGTECFLGVQRTFANLKKTADNTIHEE